MTNATKPTKEQRIFAVLCDGAWHHMRELNAIAFRYGGRLHDLREQGHRIETRRIAVGEFEYRLLPGEPKQMALI